MNFRSDNEAPVNAQIFNALAQANQGFEESYGYDAYSQQFNEQCQQLFQCWVETLPLTTGTAANSIAMALSCPPYGAIYCHESAHMNADECGAPEMFTGGAKLIPIPGAHGKIDIDALSAKLAASGAHGEHESMPAVISLTQCTEAGTVYTLDELKAFKKLKEQHGLALHMDGARFANALVSLGCTAAEMTWQSGIDMLSFGATKNGAMMAEALLVFNPKYKTQILRQRKRAGHLISKMRYVSCQLVAYLQADLWLELAQHANQQAHRFADQAGVELIHPVQANEVFCRIPVPTIQSLREQGFAFHVWPGSEDIIRLVFSHATNPDDVSQLIQALKQH